MIVKNIAINLLFKFLFFNEFIEICYSKYVEGVLNVSRNWAFISRFCFLSEVGDLRFELAYPKALAVQKLYLYYDAPDQWASVYKTSKTCEEKEAVLHRENYQILNLSTWSVDKYTYAGCTDTYNKGEEWLFCSRSLKFSSYRERWWFIAVGNCQNASRLYLEYRMWMTNGHADEFWFYHFSADEFYILPTDIPFLLIEILILVLAVVMAIILRSRQMLHGTYKLFINSLLLECLGLFCLCVAYGQYAKNGVGLPFFKLIGNMFEASSVLVFQFLLILMAKGYTITRGKLPRRTVLRLTLYMTVYSLTYAAVFIYQARFFDPGRVTYLYESPAGYGLMALRLLGWCWFCYAIYFTLVHYPEKRRFYLKFSAFYSLWFWAGPCIIIMANYVLGKWMREKIVNGVEKAIILIGYAFFLYLTRPSAANANFPYHVRANQIGTLGGHENHFVNENLPHHAYELNSTNASSVFTVEKNGQKKDEEAVRLTTNKMMISRCSESGNLIETG